MDTTDSPSKWVVIAGFAILAVLATAGTVLVLGGSVQELLYALVGGMVTAGVVLGVYVFGSRRGQPHSHAVASAAVAFGTLFLIALVYRLLTEFGA
jgi:hypothetical protein